MSNTIDTLVTEIVSSQIGDAVKVGLEQAGLATMENVQTGMQGIVDFVKAELEKRPTPTSTTVEVKRPNKDTVKVEGAHPLMPKLIQAMNTASPSDQNVMLVGPAGSGKSVLVKHFAQAMGVKYYQSGALMGEHKVAGFIDANGKIISPQFRECFEHGGAMSLDEFDRSLAKAAVWMNSSLANGWADFPDGMVERHKDCYIVASANTTGQGGDPKYAAASVLDAATLDRFVKIRIDYDHAFELSIAPNADWCKRVQHLRDEADELFPTNNPVLITPRATLRGADLLAQGWTQREVEDSTCCFGASKDALQKLYSAAGKPNAKGPTVKVTK